MHDVIQEVIEASATQCNSGGMFIATSIGALGCVVGMVWIGVVLYRSVGDICGDE